MNKIKKTTFADRIRNAWRAFCGKPAGGISLGLEIKKCYECERRLQPIKVSADVVDDHIDGLPLTEAERRARIEQALAERLTREIIEKELYTVQKHEDLIYFQTRYRATVLIYHEKGAEQ
jgi:hypothetical protein